MVTGRKVIYMFAGTIIPHFLASRILHKYNSSKIYMYMIHGFGVVAYYYSLV